MPREQYGCSKFTRTPHDTSPAHAWPPPSDLLLPLLLLRLVRMVFGGLGCRPVDGARSVACLVGGIARHTTTQYMLSFSFIYDTIL
jgi:hypothetical protein